MSLAAGPGRGGGSGAGGGQLPAELALVAEKHVAYIQSLDTVRLLNDSSSLFSPKTPSF